MSERPAATPAGPMIHVLSFEGCPHADAARAAAREAISEFGAPVECIEVDLLDPALPPEFEGYPSPTILVALREVAPSGDAAAGAACRASGAPSAAEVARMMATVWGSL